MFGQDAPVVLVLVLVELGFLWTEPKFESPSWRPLDLRRRIAARRLLGETFSPLLRVRVRVLKFGAGVQVFERHFTATQLGSGAVIVGMGHLDHHRRVVRMSIAAQDLLQKTGLDWIAKI